MSPIVRVAAGLAVVGVLAAACDDGDAVQGSGRLVTEVRPVSGFDRIAIEGGGDLVVEIGDTESLTIEAEDNLLPLLTSEVAGSRLVLGSRESISPSLPITYRAVATTFEGVSIEGSADVVASDLDCTTFEVSVQGSGEFDVSGTCAELDLSIEGSGDFNGEDLVVASANISIAGSGNALLTVTDELVVSIEGSGNVEYVGDPATDIDIAGSGSVNRRS